MLSRCGSDIKTVAKWLHSKYVKVSIRLKPITRPDYVMSFCEFSFMNTDLPILSIFLSLFLHTQTHTHTYNI